MQTWNLRSHSSKPRSLRRVDFLKTNFDNFFQKTGQIRELLTNFKTVCDGFSVCAAIFATDERCAERRLREEDDRGGVAEAVLRASWCRDVRQGSLGRAGQRNTPVIPAAHSVCITHATNTVLSLTLASTPPGMPGTHPPPNFFG